MSRHLSGDVYGYLPYWEMSSAILDYLDYDALSVISLFSVTWTGAGTLDRGEPGYAAITGSIGRSVIAAARARGVRVEISFTTFGVTKNATLFGDPARRAKVIAELRALVRQLGADGVNVDAELIEGIWFDEYGLFLATSAPRSARTIRRRPCRSPRTRTCPAPGWRGGRRMRGPIGSSSWATPTGRPGRIRGRSPPRRPVVAGRPGHPLDDRPLRCRGRPPGPRAPRPAVLRDDVAHGVVGARRGAHRVRHDVHAAQADREAGVSRRVAALRARRVDQLVRLVRQGRRDVAPGLLRHADVAPTEVRLRHLPRPCGRRDLGAGV